MGSKEESITQKEEDRENSVSPVMDEKVSSDDIKAEESPDERVSNDTESQQRTAFPLLPPMLHPPTQYPSSPSSHPGSDTENPLVLPRVPPAVSGLPFLHPAFIKMNPAVSAAAVAASGVGLPTSVYESIFRHQNAR